MKNIFKWFGIIAFVAVIIFSFSGCRKDSLDKTTWTANYQDAKVYLRFNSPNFVISVGGHTIIEGSYFVSGTTLSLLETVPAEGTDSVAFTGTVSGNILTLLNNMDEVFIEFTRQHRIFGG